MNNNAHPFAPGAIERHLPHPSRKAQRRALLRWLVRAAIAMAALLAAAYLLIPAINTGA